MKIFITGSESFIGKELIAQCETEGIDYIGVDSIEVKNPNCYQMDIRSKEIAGLIPMDVDAVVHLAALSRDGDCKNHAYECFDVNVLGTLNLINAAESKRVKNFVFASSEWVYNFNDNTIKDENSVIDITKQNSEYAFSKLVSEVNLRQKYQHGFCSVTILRFGIIYGSRLKNWSAVESIFDTVKRKNKITIGSLKTARRFIHVSDIASGIVKSLGLKDFNIINIQGDKLYSLNDVITISSQLLNKKPVIEEKEPENVSIRNVSDEKAKTLLNFSTKIDLKTGLKLLNEYIQNIE